jgi:hypothetical protein
MVFSIFFLSASVWEGIARIVPGDELPEKGYTMATNSFPPNTVVEVTNLENGKTIQVIVRSGLESTGFLAAFSRDIATAMGIRDQSLVRIRMIKINDTEAISRLTKDLPSQGAGKANNIVAPESALTKPGTQNNLTGVPELWGTITRGEARNEDLPDTIVTPLRPEERVSQGLSFNEEFVQSPGPVFPVQPRYSTNPDTPQRYDLALIPAEERPPAETADSWILPPEAEIAPLGPLPLAESLPEVTIDPSLMIPPLEDRVSVISPVQKTSPWGSEYSPFFSVPVITSLEQGKYYLQLGAFGMIELIEAELSRLGKNYPLVIQPGGNPQTPIYRILLGPVNLGESGALIQQFKSLGYNDAFIRQGSN